MSISQRFKSGIVQFVITGAWSGLSPVSPGTVGSAAALVVWYVLSSCDLLPSSNVTVLMAVAISVIGTYTTYLHLKENPALEDPGYIVIDEWAGMFFALAPLSYQEPILIGLAFAVFRLLDITKPSIIGWADNREGAFGVMLDDVLAGILTAAIIVGTKMLLM